ncbi:MAG TPA: hypothetical protein VL442_10360 [Mucilaginibacter sp.]|jgi:hypothetical protein|nr:hypothetical protein [Mucilaginibacter sp.]
MIQLNRPDPVKVEPFFNKFIQQSGGELVTNLLPQGITELNSDYFFKQEGIVAELKTFEKDLFADQEDMPRLIEMFKKWEDEKLIQKEDIVKYLVGAKMLPQECYKLIWEKASKTIDRVLHHANKQIISTKKLLNCPESLGLVFLCNDGNFLMEPEQFFGSICNIMLRKYHNSDIDGFVFFTVNQTTRKPGSNLDWTLWSPAYRKQDDHYLGDFVNKLGEKFNDFLTQETGIPASEYERTDDIIEGMNTLSNMQYTKKDIAFKKPKK